MWTYIVYDVWRGGGETRFRSETKRSGRVLRVTHSKPRPLCLGKRRARALHTAALLKLLTLTKDVLSSMLVLWACLGHAYRPHATPTRHAYRPRHAYRVSTALQLSEASTVRRFSSMSMLWYDRLCRCWLRVSNAGLCVGSRGRFASATEVMGFIFHHLRSYRSSLFALTFGKYFALCVCRHLSKKHFVLVNY